MVVTSYVIRLLIADLMPCGLVRAPFMKHIRRLPQFYILIRKLVLLVRIQLLLLFALILI